ncbi:ribulose-phosphate 3-epimerase [Nesterenkonia alkaliphila]|uniref:Ribulose-phosphate 3-epimerase n=1 Tax=Nesterenkonia alkaliphila TaxID=1463631 RepID=A0A7K1UKZ2_9MICC|nr:ribulose-phosphate 3-epimerase [Nesterenkonia alkaliphila]MVT27143.1 ribulose-phosphate 3-epimerase [Nesterenkonia alkaliphila]GFZ91232.1 ribulose-phosphate 3-epimerase [Nesterenkonia alkaliphila]
MTAIHPSILSADFANLADELARIPSADAVHVDVMDNHFVPNLTIGLPVVESIRKVTALPLDIHLMISDADRWAPQYAQAGAESVTFHVEAAAKPAQVARDLRSHGAKSAMAVKPGTALEPHLGLLAELDMLLIMTVEPGFGGQSFMDQMLPKIAAARKASDDLGGRIAVQVDGGINADTILRAAEAGADTFVAGSAVYAADDPDAAISDLRSLIK